MTHALRGRSKNRGERNPNVKLTDKQVANIWACYYQLAMTRIDLAKMYRVSEYAIGYALRVRGPALGLKRPDEGGGEAA